jgi:exodeoxyribonuclease VII small subunit
MRQGCRTPLPRLTLARTGANARAMPDAPEAISELSFEAALKRLEEIVRRLESGEASLDESIELYGEGDRLRQQCESRLQAAQAKIEKIQLGRDGQPGGTIPFDAD